MQPTRPSTAAEPTPFDPLLPRFDQLTQILDGVRLRCMLPSAHEFTAPWGVQFGMIPPEAIREHFKMMGLPSGQHVRAMHGEIIAVLRGGCCLELLERGIKRHLRSGDVTIVARNEAFVLRDEWDSPVRHVRELFKPENVHRGAGLIHGGGGVASSILTGPFFFENVGEGHPLLSALPAVLHLNAEDLQAAPWIESTLRVVDSELKTLAPGYLTIVNHLMYALFVQAIRLHATAHADQAPATWFRAVFDAQLAPALGAIHKHPEQPWKVASLAEVSQMSRSLFSQRFTELIGTPPLQYLTEYRMQRAQALLRDSTASIREIAKRVGYASESAFCNAFKRVCTTSPTQYRRESLTPP